MSEKPVYYVFSDFDNVWISTNEDTTNENKNFLGCYDVFTHAKKTAVQAMQSKVANFRHDLELAKSNRITLSRVCKKDFDIKTKKEML